MNRFLLGEKPALLDGTADEVVVGVRWRGLGVCVWWPSAGQAWGAGDVITEVSTLTKTRTIFLMTHTQLRSLWAVG